MRFVAETAHSHFNRPMPFFSCKRFLVVALKTCFSQSRSYCHRLIVFVASVAPLLLPWHVPALPFLLLFLLHLLDNVGYIFGRRMAFFFFFPQFFFRGHAVNEKRKPFPSVCPSASVHNNNDQKYQNRPFFHFITPYYYRLRFRLPSRQRHRADYAIIKESIIFKGASGIYFLRYFHANYTEKSYKSQVLGGVRVSTSQLTNRR